MTVETEPPHRDSRPRQTVNFDVTVPAVESEAAPGGVVRDRVMPLIRRYVTHADRTLHEEQAFRDWTRELTVSFLRLFSVVCVSLILLTWLGDLRFRGADQRIFDAFVLWRVAGVALFTPFVLSRQIPFVRRYPVLCVMTAYIGFVAAVGYAMGRIAGLDAPWFYVLYGCSWMTVIFPIRPAARVVSALAISVAGTLAYFLPFPEHFAHPHVDVPLINLASFTGMAILVGHIVHHLLRDNFFAHREVDAERARAQQLLHNMLPESIAARLQRSPGPLGDRFAEVTVLFADIVGFTGLAGRIPPEPLVRFLNDLFTQFDLIAQRYGLEKIKTIGDGYVVAGGLPEPRADHARAVAEMALDMRAAASQMTDPEGSSVRLRIGLQTGPVVAGVIGVHKLTYDLWGDTVNAASRLESHGVPDRIQVGEECYLQLRDRYVLEPRGTIDVKGMGELRAYFLVARNPAHFGIAT